VIDVHRTPNWVVFVTKFNWLITTTLAVGGSADILIAASMVYYLRKLVSPGNMKSYVAYEIDLLHVLTNDSGQPQS
jgi:hypothetical protein